MLPNLEFHEFSISHTIRLYICKEKASYSPWPGLVVTAKGLLDRIYSRTTYGIEPLRIGHG